MAVDLNNLVESLSREVSPPGDDQFPDADYPGMLSDAFWELRLYGMLAGFEENAKARGGPDPFGPYIVTPIGAEEGYDDPSGWSSDDLGRELQQLIVLWAAYTAALTNFSALNTVFRAKAGPVEYETQQAATVLKTILDALKERLEFIIGQLSSYGTGTTVAVLDAFVERSYAMATRDVWWIR